ncbi:transposase [Rothia mucilaginosa]|uniref:transposase n=1 Tax=Rothia mucilaginosa TaxID=43675 RepID=UPI002E28B3C8|nr:transposase [Rothia mucilaginosa]
MRWLALPDRATTTRWLIPSNQSALRPKVAQIFSRTPNGCGHRQVAMCLRAEEGVRIADKTVLKMMRQMGRAVYAVRGPITGTTPTRGMWGKVSPISSVATSRRLVLGRSWAPTSPSSSFPSVRPISLRFMTLPVKRLLPTPSRCVLILPRRDASGTRGG